MGNHIQDILEQWHPNRDTCHWVLGTVISTEGSSYRKAGAMMMFNHLGEFFGLLSGGCLEKALFNDVKKVLSLQATRVVEFDSTGDTDVAWQLGLGCGGKVRILLQPVHADNAYQQLGELRAALSARETVQYCVEIGEANAACGSIGTTANYLQASLTHQPSRSRSGLQDSQTLDNRVLHITHKARRHLAIFGGGVDAVPLVQMAKNIGWQVAVIDHRVSYASEAHFYAADSIVREQATHPTVHAIITRADAAFVMTHNIQWDACALSALLPSAIKYIGLLGPSHRKHRVLAKAGLKPDGRIHGPMGLALGGELPESIALSALAQCHQVLEQVNVQVAPTKSRASSR